MKKRSRNHSRILATVVLCSELGVLRTSTRNFERYYTSSCPHYESANEKSNSEHIGPRHFLSTFDQVSSWYQEFLRDTFCCWFISNLGFSLKTRMQHPSIDFLKFHSRPKISSERRMESVVSLKNPKVRAGPPWRGAARGGGYSVEKTLIASLRRLYHAFLFCFLQ